MNRILKSIRSVVDQSRHVKINKKNLEKVCENFNPEDVKFWMENSPLDLSALNYKDRINFIFIFNSINFCYWGEPKWTIEYKGKKYDGAWAMITCFRKAIENKAPILDTKYLAGITKKDLTKILKGNIEIPLFEERFKILREISRGNFLDAVKKSGKDALKLLDIITTDFSSYNDVAIYKDSKVFFHKRAQLAIHDVHRACCELKNINQLTAAADYKIPQTLRKLGVLEYAVELVEKVDNKILIPQGSEEEIEIRANMIWAVELMRRELKNISAIDIDSCLWLQGQNKSPDDKPYHLTKTIFY